MAKVHYVNCPVCHKDYYIDGILYEVLLVDTNQKLKCPFCKNEFRFDPNAEPATGPSGKVK